MMYPELENAPLIGRRPLFERDSIERCAAKGIDRMLLERGLHCMEYVAQLQDVGLDFTFKGGTASQLLVGAGLQRLSIDIDITTKTTEDELRRCMGTIAERTGNRTYSPADVPKKGLDRMPLLMFNISAPTYFPYQKRETMVKLDVVMKPTRYETTQTRLSTFYFESDVRVRTPTVSSMLGDKLSTLGPKTVGIGADLAVDNIKQFYDIGNLLPTGFRLSSVGSAYIMCCEDVIGWRGLSVSIEDALCDLADWCKVASSLQFLPPRSPRDRADAVRSMASGLDGFTGYIARDNSITKRRLREISSRIALLSRVMADGNLPEDLTEFIREPSRFRERIINGFEEVMIGLGKVQPGDRWHIHISEFKNNPVAMACWFGYWYPEELATILSTGT